VRYLSSSRSPPLDEYAAKNSAVLRLSGHPKPANEGHLKTGQR
jgi:hypothetical protein